MSNFLSFELHKSTGSVMIKPGEIVSFSPAPEGGTRLVTRQKQVYYVTEEMDEVNAMIEIFFKKIKGDS